MNAAVAPETSSKASRAANSTTKPHIYSSDRQAALTDSTNAAAGEIRFPAIQVFFPQAGGSPRRCRAPIPPPIPMSRDASRWAVNKTTPNRTLPIIPAPTALMMNAGPPLTQKRSIRRPSSPVICPLSTSSPTAMPPVGYPPINPIRIPGAQQPGQAEQGPGHSLQAPPQRRADPGTHQKPCQHQKREERGNDDPEQMERPRLTPPAAAWGQISSAAPAARIRISSPPIFRCAARTVLTNIPFTLSSSA